MPLNQLFGISDNVGNEYSQYETNDAIASLAYSRFTPTEKEAGMLTITYNGVNINTGAAVNRMKLVRYKMVNGVTTLVGATNVFSNADTGMSTSDVVTTVSGQDVVMSITGIAGATIRHTYKVERLSSQLMG